MPGVLQKRGNLEIREMNSDKAPSYQWPDDPIVKKGQSGWPDDPIESRPSSLRTKPEPANTGRQAPAAPTTSMRALKPSDTKAFDVTRKQVADLKKQYLKSGDGSVVRHVADLLIKDPRNEGALAHLHLMHINTQQAILETVQAERGQRSNYDPNDPLAYAHNLAEREGGVKGLIRGNVAGAVDPRMLALGAVIPGGEALAEGIALKAGTKYLGRKAGVTAAKAVPRVAAGAAGAAGAGMMAQQAHDAYKRGDKEQALAASLGALASLGFGGFGAAVGRTRTKLGEGQRADLRAAEEAARGTAEKVGEEKAALQRISTYKEHPDKTATREVLTERLSQKKQAKAATARSLPRETLLPEDDTLSFDKWLEEIENKAGVLPKSDVQPTTKPGPGVSELPGKVLIKTGPGSPVKRGPQPRTTLAPGEIAEEAPPGKAPIQMKPGPKTFRQRLDDAEKIIDASMKAPKKGVGGSSLLPHLVAKGVIHAAKRGIDFGEWSKSMLDDLKGNPEALEYFNKHTELVYGIAVRRHQKMNAPASPGSPEYTIGGDNATQEGQGQKGSVGEHPGVSQGANVPKDSGQVRQGKGGQAGDSGSPKPTAPVEPEKDEAVKAVLAKLREAKKKAPAVRERYSQQRGVRGGEYEKLREAGATQTEAGMRASRGVLAGQLEQPPYEPLDLEQPVADKLYSRIENSSLYTYNAQTAHEGLDKLLGRGEYAADKKGVRIPAPHEIKQLRKVFGDRFVDEAMDDRARSWGRTLVDILGIPRAIMETGNLHATLRQALPLSVANPKAGVAAIGRGLLGMVSDKQARIVNEQIRNGPNSKLYDQFNLHLSGPNLNQREEDFQGRIAERIPLLGPFVKSSSRAFSTQLNVLRSKVFDDGVKMLKAKSIMPASQPQEYKALAKYINKMTGWGEFGKADDLAPYLNTVLYSPRLQVSRIQLMMDAATGFKSYPPEARKRAIKDLGANAAFLLSTMGLAKATGAEVDTNPDSADFGKIKVKNTRFDISGGFGSLLRPLIRYMAQEYKMHASGSPPAFGKSSPGSVLARAGRSKLSPVISLGTDISEGSDYAGKPMATLKQIGENVKDRFSPIVLAEIVKGMQDENGASPVLLIPLGFFGAGEQTYERTARPGRTKKIRVSTPNY